VKNVTPRRYFLYALLLVSWPSAVHAGAWTKPRNHFYLQLGIGFSDATERFNSDGDARPIVVQKFAEPGTHDVNVSNYQQLVTDLYFEYGILDRLTVFGDLPVLSARQKNPGGDISYSETAFADMMLGARVGLLLQPLAVALETRLGFPTGNTMARIPTGSGDFRGELRFVFGRAFRRVPIYFDVEFGFMLRGTGKVPDPSLAGGVKLVAYDPELVLHGEVGGVLLRWRDQDRLILSVAADYRGSTVQASADDTLFTVIPQNSRITSVGVAASAILYKWFGVLVRYAGAVEGLRLPKVNTVSGALFVSY
jgi:hypothetical protein